MQQVSKKVCLLGTFAVGKTSLVRRFVFSLFEDTYLSTIGVKVSRKTVMLPCPAGTVDVTLMLWDLADSEEFDQVRASYLRGAAGAVLVCDITRPFTLDRLPEYAAELQGISPGAQLVIAANKVDLAAEAALPSARVVEVGSELGAPVHFTSAKTGAEVENAFRRLAQMLAGSTEEPW